MEAGTQRNWKTTLQHAFIITIGLYLATLPIPMSINKPVQVRKPEAIELFPNPTPTATPNSINLNPG